MRHSLGMTALIEKNAQNLASAARAVEKEWIRREYDVFSVGTNDLCAATRASKGSPV